MTEPKAGDVVIARVDMTDVLKLLERFIGVADEVDAERATAMCAGALMMLVALYGDRPFSWPRERLLELLTELNNLIIERVTGEKAPSMLQ